MKNMAANPRKSTVLRGVKSPSSASTVPTTYKTRGIPNSCFIMTPEKSAVFVPFVTRRPVASEIRSEGIDEEMAKVSGIYDQLNPQIDQLTGKIL